MLFNVCIYSLVVVIIFLEELRRRCPNLISHIYFSNLFSIFTYIPSPISHLKVTTLSLLPAISNKFFFREFSNKLNLLLTKY